MVRSGLVMAWRLATSPTSTSPVLEKPTTDGVVRPPSALGITTGSPASNTLTTELVVPKSIPTALAICSPSIRLRDHHYTKPECLRINFSALLTNPCCIIPGQPVHQEMSTPYLDPPRRPITSPTCGFRTRSEGT